MTSDTYGKALGRKLRAIRKQQGLSLQGVEEKSQGRWKAVVVGSYERGDRSVTVSKLAELAEFYGVPMAEMLPDAGSRSAGDAPGKLVLSLEHLRTVEDPEARPLARYVASIQARRGDYNGRVLSIRHEDLRALTIIYDCAVDVLIEMLIDWNVLPPETQQGDF